MSYGNAVAQIWEAFGFLKAAEFALRKLLAPNSEMHMTPSGILHPIVIRVNSSDIYPAIQIFLGQEYKFSCKSDPKTVVDAGANIGLTSVIFANRFPKANILAIEPEQGNFEQAKRNLAPYPNVKVIHAALWCNSDGIRLVDPGLGEWGFQTTSATGASDDILVKSLTVSDIINENDWGHIDILKMDIEGAEVEVLSESRSWIEKIGLMITELHDGEREQSSRVFYKNTNNFDRDWRRGENVYTLNSRIFSAGPE